MTFWEKLNTVLNPGGSQKYGEIPFSLPHHSATCERLFSIINLNKTKIPDTLNTTTLRGLPYGRTIIRDNYFYNYLINPGHLAKRNSIIIKLSENL